jgi:hypothetical protein
MTNATDRSYNDFHYDIIWNRLSGEPPWRLAVGSKISFSMPSLSHGASYTVHGTVCENSGLKDIAVASDWPWPLASTWPTGIYGGQPVPLFSHFTAIGHFGATRHHGADHHHAAYARGCSMELPERLIMTIQDTTQWHRPPWQPQSTTAVNQPTTLWHQPTIHQPITDRQQLPPTSTANNYIQETIVFHSGPQIPATSPTQYSSWQHPHYHQQ